MEPSSTRPYLIRALHEWCTDNGYAPHIAVRVDATVRVPLEYVRNDEIVLNVSFDATNGLRLGNDFIEFKARFGGVPRDVVVPIGHVVAIYARENGQGMAFPPPESAQSSDVSGAELPETEVKPADDRVATLRPVPNPPASAADGSDDSEPPPDGSGRNGGRPQLKRVK